MSTVLIKQNNYWFAQSNLIHVFPCSFRSQNGDYTFDPEARLQTEKNYTNLQLTFNDTDGYIIEKEIQKTKISLAGYYFELDLANDDDIWAEKDLYIVLGLKETSIDPNANYKTNVLKNLYQDSSWNQLDLVATSGEYIFCGLGFTNTIPDSSLKYIKVGTNDSFPVKYNRVLSNETNSSITGNLVNGAGVNSVRGLASTSDSGDNSVILGDNTSSSFSRNFVFGKNLKASSDDQVIFGLGKDASQTSPEISNPGFYIYKEGVRLSLDYTKNNVNITAGNELNLNGYVKAYDINRLNLKNSSSSRVSTMTFTLPPITSNFIYDSNKFLLQTIDGNSSNAVYLATGTRLEKPITTTSDKGLTSLTTNVGINNNTCGEDAKGQLNIGQGANVENTNYLNIGNYTGSDGGTSNILEVSKSGMNLRGSFNLNDNITLSDNTFHAYNTLNVISPSTKFTGGAIKFANSIVDFTTTNTNALTINTNQIILTNLGEIVATGNITSSKVITGQSMNTLSDRRLKTNIKDFTYNKSILNLPVKEFDYISSGEHSIGCIAQDLQEIYPELVNTNSDGYLSIKESKLVYLLLEEVRQLRKELDELKGA